MFISQPCWKRPILAVNQMELVASDLFRRSLPEQSEDHPKKPTPSRHRFEKPIHNVKKLAA